AAAMVQYVVVRSDLLHTLNWPVGAVITQACHACSAVIHMFHDDPNTQAYLVDLDNMHKVVLQANDESTLKELSRTLENESIDHKLWMEQPENVATCLATKPYRKDKVQKYFKTFKLFK
ncbi:putative peptidyl-tRNA hydrolase PTRHD1, partial [Lamellibrachia satsuma]